MTAPTIADHQKNAVRFPSCCCGAVWRQRGNSTGHCTRCHETFQGIELFDRHQHIQPDGSVRCLDPHSIKLRHQLLELVEGVWRGPRMPDHVIAARFGTRDATEPPPETAQTPEQARNAPVEDQDAPDAPHGRSDT